MSQFCTKCGTKKDIHHCPTCNQEYCYDHIMQHQEKCKGPQILDLTDFVVGTHRKAARPALNYPGSKWKSVPYILPHLPLRGTYVEVFGGSGAVLFGKQPEDLEIYNDRFGGVFCFFKMLRERPQELQERLACTLLSREDFEYCHNTWIECPDELERAARWYYAAYYSFGGKGDCFGRITKPRQSPYAGKILNRIVDFPVYAERLRHVTIENLDWRDIVRDYDHDDATFYMDPPYHEAGNPNYTFNTTNLNHRELLQTIFTLKGYVLLSGYTNSLYDASEWKWDERHTWTRRDTLSGIAYTPENHLEKTIRNTVEEVLWIKHAKWERE